MNFWQAFDQIEPIGDERRQFAMVCALLSYALKIELAKSGVKAESREEDDYMGPSYVRESVPVGEPEISNIEATAKQFAGL